MARTITIGMLVALALLSAAGLVQGLNCYTYCEVTGTPDETGMASCEDGTSSTPVATACQATMDKPPESLEDAFAMDTQQVATICGKLVMKTGSTIVTKGECLAKGTCAATKKMMPQMTAIAQAFGGDVPEVKSCNECSGDHCNTANGQSAGAWIALLASAVTLSVTFHT